MSNYYKYNFISPEPLFATVREELKSYFDTGAVDDLLFPTYLNKCLNKLGKPGYSIQEEVLFIDDFYERLPDNFHAVREAWLCAEIPLRPVPISHSFYSQSKNTTIQISPIIVNGEYCTPETECNDDCNSCPELIEAAVYKSNSEIPRAITHKFLLKPGNISAYTNCDLHYINRENFPYASSTDSFDIRDNKFVTNFRSGVVHLLYYANLVDDSGNQMIPDNYRIKEYIEAFLKFKVFEILYNQVNDETLKQLEGKLNFYKQLSDEAYILADIEIKKQDAYTKVNRIKKLKNSFNKYKLPGGLKYGRNNRT